MADKTKKELIEQIKLLQKRIVELETVESERKQSEEMLRRTKQQMEFILGATKTGLDIIDSDSNIVYIDPEWQKVYGNPVGKKCYKYFMGRNTACPDCGVVKALRTKKPFVNEEVLVKEGNRPIQVTTIPFQNEKGEWLVAEVNVDITERKKAEKELNVRQERFIELTNLLPEAVFEIDLKGRFTFVNKRALKISGYSQEDLDKGLNSLQVVAPEEQEHLARNTHLVLSGKDIGITEYIAMKKDGAKFPVLIHSSAIKREGNIVGLRGIIIDISERKRAEDELKRSEQELREDKLLLEQKNLALRELVEHMERTKNKTKEDIAINVEEFIMPVLKKLKIKGASSKYVKLLEHHLKELTSSFGSKITQRSARLTPREIEICNMIKGNLASKDISELLNVSRQTIEKHRKNARKKLGLSHKKANLASYLQKI